MLVYPDLGVRFAPVMNYQCVFRKRSNGSLNDNSQYKIYISNRVAPVMLILCS